FRSFRRDFDADPRVPLILGRSFLKTERDLIDVFEGEPTLRVGKEAITFNLDQTSRYSANYNDMITNRIDVIDMACEEYSQEVLSVFDMITLRYSANYNDMTVNRIDVIDMACKEYSQEVLATVGNTQHGYAAIAYQVVECETEATKDKVHPTNNESTKDIRPSVVQTEFQILNSEPVISPITKPVASPVSAPKPNLRPSIPYPSRMQDLKLHDKANEQRDKFFQIFKDLNYNISFATLI
nr:reverse transcriptase domain-containing protein [Tanacetum cinerariifolium]